MCVREFRRDAGTTAGGGDVIYGRISSCMDKGAFTQDGESYWQQPGQTSIVQVFSTEGFSQHATAVLMWLCQYDMCNLCGDAVLDGHKGPGNFCSATLIGQGQYTQNWDGDGPLTGPMHTSCSRVYSKCPQWSFCPTTLLVLGSQQRSLFAGPSTLRTSDW